MARGFTLLSRRNSLIPRVQVQARHRVWAKTDPTDPFENSPGEVTYTLFTAEECSIQSITGKAKKEQNNQLTEAGDEEFDSYNVWSETILVPAREGTKELADQLLLEDSRGEMTWFTVMKVIKHPSSGVNRYKYYLIAVPPNTEGAL